jgi:hypothetical protein
MTALGRDPEAVVMREIHDVGEAQRAGFVGSPTIRVGGRDVVDASDEPVGLGCRVYRLRDGRVSAVPDRADVRAALTRPS